MTETGTFASTIDVVEQLVDLAARRGDGSGMHGLRRRARSILDPPKPARTAVEVEQASIDREHAYWVVAISGLLLPAQRDGVVAALRAGHEHKDGGRIIEDPWASIDPDARRTRDQAMAGQMLRAEHAAIAACHRYERTRRTSNLRDAVLELESAMEAEHEHNCSGPSTAACGEQGDRLGRALRQVLPPSAFRFFATTVRDDIAQHVAETRRESPAHRSDAEQWLSRETWTVCSDEKRAVGVWFVDWLQDRYEEEMERDRLAEEVEERRLRQAAEKYGQWQAARDEGARLERVQEKASERDAVTKPSVADGSSTGEEDHAFEVPPPPEPKMHSDYVAWPFHAEENARFKEAARQRAIAEHAEFMQERQLLAWKEAERIRAEVAEKERVEAFEALAARKASPARIQPGS